MSDTTSRRDFMRIAVLGAGASLLAACAPAAQAPAPAAPTAAPKAPAAAPTTAPAAPAAAPTTAPAAPKPAPAATAAPAASKAQPKTGGTMRVGRAGDFLHFDPFFAVTVNLPMYRQLFNTLAVYDEKLQPQPQLAERWQLSEDKQRLTFTLRKGVKFHNGRELTTDDIVKNFERAANRDLNHSLFGYTRPITGVKAVDATNVEVTFSEPAPQIWDLVTVMGIVAPEASSPDDMKSRPIGTGPFKFQEWLPGQHARFVKFADYWESGRPYLDEVVIRAMPDPQAILANLEAGGLDIMQAVPLNEVPRLRNDQNVRIVLGTEASQFYTVYMNVARPPFDKKEVRQAVAHAIDRKTIVDTVLYGVGKASQTPFPDWSLAYDPKHVDWFPYNLDKAKQLLTTAGFPNGFETSITTISSSPELKNYAQVIQADLAKIGVKMNINDISSAEWNQVWPAKQYDMMAASAGFSHKDPATLFASMSGYRLNDNRTNFSPPTYRELVTQGETITDPVKRKEAYNKLAEYMLDEAFAQVVSFKYNVFAVRSNVNGFSVHLDDDMDLTSAWLA
jgi:peptide/nickel transport system substrate-binding protein